MRSHRVLGTAMAVGLMAAACGSPAPTPRASPSIMAQSPVPSVTATPVTTANPSLLIDDLPVVDLAQVDATAVCDPEPAQADLDAGESTIPCSDGLKLALRDLRTVTPDPVTRLYLQRPVCATVPCSADELNTADVTLWTATQAFSVELDARLATVAPPSIDADPVWPAPGDTPEPAVRRPSIEGAPRDVADREPYPYCGKAQVAGLPEVVACFRDAVLAGRPAEMTRSVFGTEGQAGQEIYRYDGQGRVILLRSDRSVDANGRPVDTWQRTEGALILGITPLTWDFDPWDRTMRVIAHA